MRTGVSLVWRLRHVSRAKAELVMPLSPRLLSDDMVGLQQAAIAGLGIVALPGYVCRGEVQAGRVARVLSDWILADRQGLLPSVRAFIDHLAAEFPRWS